MTYSPNNDFFRKDAVTLKFQCCITSYADMSKKTIQIRKKQGLIFKEEQEELKNHIKPLEIHIPFKSFIAPWAS